MGLKRVDKVRNMDTRMIGAPQILLQIICLSQNHEIHSREIFWSKTEAEGEKGAEANICLFIKIGDFSGQRLMYRCQDLGDRRKCQKEDISIIIFDRQISFFDFSFNLSPYNLLMNQLKCSICNFKLFFPLRNTLLWKLHPQRRSLMI